MLISNRSKRDAYFMKDEEEKRKLTRGITKLFKTNNLPLIFKTVNATRNHWKQREQLIRRRVRAHQLACGGSLMNCIRQTERAFKTRPREHLQAIGTNTQSCRQGKHVLNTESR
jgi:hypothetical protein